MTPLRIRLIGTAFTTLSAHAAMDRFSTLAMAIEIVDHGSVSRRLRVRQAMRYGARRRRLEVTIEAALQAVRAERWAWLAEFNQRFDEEHLKGLRDSEFAEKVEQIMSVPLRLDGWLRADEGYE